MSEEAIILKKDAGGRVLVPVERRVELVREFERSGLSGPRFAEMAGVKYPTFAAWRRRHGTLPPTRRNQSMKPLWRWPAQMGQSPRPMTSTRDPPGRSGYSSDERENMPEAYEASGTIGPAFARHCGIKYPTQTGMPVDSRAIKRPLLLSIAPRIS